MTIYKELPPIPLAPLEPVDVRRLRQENQQLKLLNERLQEQLKVLEAQVEVQAGEKNSSQEVAERLTEDLKMRDNIVAEIAETIISQFQRYQRAVREEEIVVYSRFEESPDGSFI